MGSGSTSDSEGENQECVHDQRYSEAVHIVGVEVAESFVNLIQKPRRGNLGRWGLVLVWRDR
jgi:hypothetical protein